MGADLNFKVDKAGDRISQYDKQIQEAVDKITDPNNPMSQKELLQAQKAMQDRQMLIESFSQLMKTDHDTQEASLHNQK